MSAVLIDVLLIAILIGAGFSGWRQGAITSALSLVGVVAGLIVGFALAPFVADFFDAHNVKLTMVLLTVVAMVGLGNLVGATVGARTRDNMRTRTSQTWDSAIGAVLQFLIVTAVVWVLAVPAAANLPGGVGDSVRQSRVLAGIDRIAPGWAKKLPEHVAALLDESGLPPLVSPFQASGKVDAPDPADVDPAMVDRARPSVVHVLGDAQRCSKRMSGSGFVVAEDYVVTNAHVVAGTNAVSLDTTLGVKKAEVVFFDPEADLAVLHSEQLGIDPLPVSDTPLGKGDPAVVMGFPKSGPFAANPARIRDKINISGPDIYATGRAEREAYSLRGDIRQGNSGGPVLNTSGEVVGVVFGASVDSTETGYALTMAHVREVVGDYSTLTTAVDTQQCVL